MNQATTDQLRAQEEARQIARIKLKRYKTPDLDQIRIGVVSTWTGARRQPQDFVIPGVCAAEVKTTASPKMQKVRVNGENQLDPAGLPGLFLVCLRVEESPSASEGLNDVVASLRALAHGNADLRAVLDARLAEAGYLDRHADRYEAPRWRVAEFRAFEVVEGFPRVTATGLDRPSSDEETEISWAQTIPADVWYGISAWAKETGSLAPWQRSLAFSLGGIASRGRAPSRKQAVQGRRLHDEAIRLGFAAPST